MNTGKLRVHLFQFGLVGIPGAAALLSAEEVRVIASAIASVLLEVWRCHMHIVN